MPPLSIGPGVDGALGASWASTSACRTIIALEIIMCVVNALARGRIFVFNLFLYLLPDAALSGLVCAGDTPVNFNRCEPIFHLQFGLPGVIPISSRPERNVLSILGQ